MSMSRYPEYKDSGVEWLGEVPAHWEVAPFYSLATERGESNVECWKTIFYRLATAVLFQRTSLQMMGYFLSHLRHIKLLGQEILFFD